MGHLHLMSHMSQSHDTGSPGRLRLCATASSTRLISNWICADLDDHPDIETIPENDRIPPIGRKIGPVPTEKNFGIPIMLFYPVTVFPYNFAIKWMKYRKHIWPPNTCDDDWFVQIHELLETNSKNISRYFEN